MADKNTTQPEAGHEGHDHSHAVTPKLLLKPRITEKASTSATKDLPAFVFEIGPTMTKGEVTAIIKKEYKVTPIKVHTITVPRKKIFYRGKWGVKAGLKKALVYLKKGDTIDLSKLV